MQAIAGKLGLKSLKIKTYSINQSFVLGQGAFGIVYKATDAKKNPVAAKRIDGQVHSRIFEQDYQRLLELDHENIAKTLDFEMDHGICWMFMPFYEKGDLNKFYRTHDVTIGTGSEIMRQIMSGIAYLHENSIIHRDIKPGNILVASDQPISIKLTDFDVTKFLDPDIETSLMSSNVGTAAFKAPEFFMRNEKRKISYHRNVDVYAAGLTFLAMLQYKKPEPMLVPRIETPTEDSELFLPIGQIVAERIRYKVQEREITVHNKTKMSKEVSLRELIRKITCENPKDRLAAADCLMMLDKIAMPEFQLKKAGTMHTKLEYAKSMFVSSRNQIIVAGWDNERKSVIRVMDHSGGFIKDITSLCSAGHPNCRCVVEHPGDPNCVLESCSVCDVIRIYHVDSGQVDAVLTGHEPEALCRGPDDSVLVWIVGGRIQQLKWNESDPQEFNLNVNFPEMVILSSSMSYIQHHDILVLLNYNFIKGMKLSDGSVLWTTENKDLGACAVATDSHYGVYYCSDGELLVRDPSNGNVLHQIKMNVSGSVQDICWTPFQPNLRILTRDGQIEGLMFE